MPTLTNLQIHLHGNQPVNEAAQDVGGWTQVGGRKGSGYKEVASRKFPDNSRKQQGPRLVKHVQKPPMKPKQWRFVPGYGSTLRKDIHVMGRNLEDQSKLTYVPPHTKSDGINFASINGAEIDININKWNNTLVGCVLGEKPYFLHLKACVFRLW